MLSHSFIAAQILGIITTVLFVISLQQRKKESFLLLQTIGTLLFVAQYLLTDRITGAATFAVVAVRGMVFYFYSKKELKPSLAVLIVFLIALIVSTCLTWQNLLSLIPLAATAAKTWGTWQEDMRWTRRTSLLGQACMVVYNLAASMYTGTLTELCNLVSTLVAMRRYDSHKGGAPE